MTADRRDPLTATPHWRPPLARDRAALVIHGPLDSSITPVVRRYIEQRTGFKLGKFGLAVDRVTIRLETGPRASGRTRAHCQITAHLPGIGNVLVEELAFTVCAAFDGAADRLERSVRLDLDRARTIRRNIRVAHALHRGQRRRRAARKPRRL